MLIFVLTISQERNSKANICLFSMGSWKATDFFFLPVLSTWIQQNINEFLSHHKHTKVVLCKGVFFFSSARAVTDLNGAVPNKWFIWSKTQIFFNYWMKFMIPRIIKVITKLALSISEKCQQYAIDSKVYLIGNVVDAWHNWLETLGTRLLREETIVKTPSGLFTSELKQMAFTAIRKRNSWFLTKSERKKYKNTLDISHDGFYLFNSTET